MMRIAITGPESSGKTTLAMELSQELGVHSCPEYARAFLDSAKGEYSFSDLDTIASGQVELWQIAIPPIICDTEMTVIKIWSEVKFGKVSPLVMNLYNEQVFDHYFLCAPDIPWEPDPLREDPDQRDWLFQLYENELIRLRRPYTILTGGKKDRIKKSRDVLEKLNLI